MLLVLGFTLMLVLGTVVFFIKDKSGSGGGDSSSSSSLLPIWVAIFIPIIIAQNKNKKPLNPKQQKLITYSLVGGLTLLLILGILAFLMNIQLQIILILLVATAVLGIAIAAIKLFIKD